MHNRAAHTECWFEYKIVAHPYPTFTESGWRKKKISEADNPHERVHLADPHDRTGELNPGPIIPWNEIRSPHVSRTKPSLRRLATHVLCLLHVPG
ncbi:hypothetical protein A5626_17750 [Mycobacterium marseillense]|nr:hypothetical protein A5626_17750 [Mycobacterium marseillense]